MQSMVDDSDSITIDCESSLKAGGGPLRTNGNHLLAIQPGEEAPPMSSSNFYRDKEKTNYGPDGEPFFNRRLAKDQSDSKISQYQSNSNTNLLIVPMDEVNPTHFGGSQQNWMQGSHRQNPTTQAITSAQIPKQHNHYPPYQPRARQQQQKFPHEAGVDMAALLNKPTAYQVPASASKPGARHPRMLQGPKRSNQLSSSIPEEHQTDERTAHHGGHANLPKNAIRVQTTGNQQLHGRGKKYTISVLQATSPPISQKRDSPDAVNLQARGRVGAGIQIHRDQQPHGQEKRSQFLHQIEKGKPNVPLKKPKPKAAPTQKDTNRIYFDQYHQDKAMSRNTVYGVPFLDQKTQKLTTSTDYENSILDHEENSRGPSQATYEKSQQQKYQRNGANHTSKRGFLASSQQARPTESQQKIKRYRLNSAIQEDRDESSIQRIASMSRQNPVRAPKQLFSLQDEQRNQSPEAPDRKQKKHPVNPAQGGCVNPQALNVKHQSQYSKTGKQVLAPHEQLPIKKNKNMLKESLDSVQSMKQQIDQQCDKQQKVPMTPNYLQQSQSQTSNNFQEAAKAREGQSSKQRQHTNKVRTEKPFEYSPENQHNVSLTTAATAAESTANGGAFQISMSKNQQVQKFLTKEVQPETSLLHYNFNDYGQSQHNAQSSQAQRPNQNLFHNQTDVRLSGVITGDRVPSRQNLTRGSRRRTRGSAIEIESNNPPGVMTDPNEFGNPHVSNQAPIHQFENQNHNQQFHRLSGQPAQSQPVAMYRLGSPFQDLRRKQKVILPSLSGHPVITNQNFNRQANQLLKQKKIGGRTSGSHEHRSAENSQRSGNEQSNQMHPGSHTTLNRSPMRTTSFGVNMGMEIIKEEEPQ